MTFDLEGLLRETASEITPIVPFNPARDRLLPMDFTASNTELTTDILNNPQRFEEWVAGRLLESGCRYGIGGYNEHRTIYSRSAHFDGDGEPRRLHLGTDIWGPAGTSVYAPLAGKVHSFRDNAAFGDYGATIILSHELAGLRFYTLYGHLSGASIRNLSKGMSFAKGEPLAAFGPPEENGGWPPHLHLQVIVDMQGMEGDYPGVCRFQERAGYLQNCPDPAPLIGM
jgi:peptidoglycan LD-endopeptidase LytH